MTDPVDVKLIEEWLALDGKRTPGEWSDALDDCGEHDATWIIDAEESSVCSIDSPAHEKQDEHNAAFIAASSRIGPVIRALLAERKARESEREGLRTALALYESVYPHSAPHDCFATGPRTGDALMDLVACPGCECQRRAREALAGAGK